MSGHKKLTFCCMLLLTASSVYARTRQEFIQRMRELRENEQFTETLPFRNILEQAQYKGAYKIDSFFNFRGDCDQMQSRHTMKIWDTETFIGQFVALQTFDMKKYTNIQAAGRAEMEGVAQVAVQFLDQNRPNSSIVTFYDQAYNATGGYWYTQPENHYMILKSGSGAFQNFASVLLGPAPLPPGLDGVFGARRIADRLVIPSDYDSTFINLDFGAELYRARDIYPEAWAIWHKDNFYPERVLEALKEHAYRPFSGDGVTNVIDPRSYFCIRFFLDKAKKEGRDLAFAPVWVSNLNEWKKSHYGGDKPVFGAVVNTIDVACSVNFMNGFISAFSTGLYDHDVVMNDPDLELILNTTGSLIVNMFETNFTDRYDIAMLQYSSPMLVYWMVSTGLLDMERELSQGKPTLTDYYHGLKAVMTTTITQVILDAGQRDSTGGIFFDDFLGGADVSYYGRPINRAEDRLYTTAHAASALMYTWSVYDNVKQQAKWKYSVPVAVKETVKGCVKWLEENALTGQYRAYGSFFTFDFKSRESVGYFYPANRFEYSNGTRIDTFTSVPNEPTVYGMEGVVDLDEYDRLLTQDWFGSKTPMTFEGFNNVQGNTTFWSGDALTYSGVMLAASFYDTLDN